MESRYPGFSARLLDEDGRLLSNLAIAIDGEVTPLGLRETVEPESEIHIVAAISGGRGAAASTAGGAGAPRSVCAEGR